jgi:predicted transcriptional regulator
VVFYDTLFEFSNENRFKILRLLEHSPLKITQLSKVLNLSLTEISRHSARLVEIRVILKDSDGNYNLSPFGQLMLKQFSSLEFVSRHQEYFNSHKLKLPQKFLSRLGELSDCFYTDDVMQTFFHINRMMEEADEFFWNITDQYIMSTIPHVKRIARNGIKARSIDLVGYIFPKEMKISVSEEDKESAYRARELGNIEMRTLESIDVFLWMSEKEVAALAFPNIQGVFDYTGFNSKSENAINWCKDLFLYYWEKAERKTEFSLF